jgi:hypothetical protein
MAPEVRMLALFWRAIGVLVRRHPAAAAGLACVVLGAVAWGEGASGTTRAGGRARALDDLEVAAPRSPRAILNRVWFDKYPEKSRDEVRIWIFLAGGIGITERGSVWKSSYEIFELERADDKLSVTWLQDRKRAETRFAVESCDDTPPFDLCLTLTNPLRGSVKRYYGFGDSEDLKEHVPWAAGSLAAARERLSVVPKR